MSWFSRSSGHLIASLWKYRWTYLVPIATLLLPATIYALRLPPTYDAEAFVQVTEMRDADRRSDVVAHRSMSDNKLVSLARNKILKTENLKALVPWLAPEGSEDDKNLLLELAERVEYDRLGPQLFKIKITDEDPLVAKNAVNALVYKFAEGERAGPLAKAKSSEEFFREQRDAASKEAERAGKAVHTFLKSHPDVQEGQREFLDKQLQSTQTQIQNLLTLASTYKAQEEEYRRKLTGGEGAASNQKTRPDSTEEIRLKGQLKNIQDGLGKAKFELARTSARFPEKSRRVRIARQDLERLEREEGRIVGKLDEERKRQDKLWKAKIRQESTGSRNALEKQLARAEKDFENTQADLIVLRERAASLRKRVIAIPTLALKLNPLKAEFALKQKDLVEVTQKHLAALQDLKYYKEAKSDFVTPYTVTQEAVAPAKPSGPSRMKYLLSALVLGGLLGYGIMLLRRKFDEGSDVTPDDIAGLLPGALVVSVPRLGSAPRRKSGGLMLDVVCATWVGALMGITVLAIAVHKHLIDGPPFIRSLIGMDV